MPTITDTELFQTKPKSRRTIVDTDLFKIGAPAQKPSRDKWFPDLNKINQPPTVMQPPETFVTGAPPEVAKPPLPVTVEGFQSPGTMRPATPVTSKPQIVEPSLPQQKPAVHNDMFRKDGTRKGMGYFGELQRPDGMVSTELSIGVGFDGKETEIPSLVPTLTKKEVDYLLAGNEPTKKIIDKAVKHAKERMSQGKSPFAQEGEQVKQKTDLPVRQEIRQPALPKEAFGPVAQGPVDPQSLVEFEKTLTKKKSKQGVVERLGVEEIVQSFKEMVWPTNQYTREESDKMAKELGKSLKLAGKYYLTLGGRLGPKGLRESLKKDAEELHGFGPALIPAAGEFGATAIEWGFIYPALFKAAGMGTAAINRIPQVQKATEVIKSMGGLDAVAEKFPRLYNAAAKTIGAFGKGSLVGGVVGTAEAIGKDMTGREILEHVAKEAAIMGGVAATFQAVSEVDTRLYVGKLRKSLLNSTNKQIEAALKRVDAMPNGPQKTASMKSLQSQKRTMLQNVDKIISNAEAQLRGMKANKLYQQGQEQVESPERAAERFIKQGLTTGKPFESGPESLKTGLGKSEPFIQMPTTRTGEVIETIRGQGKVPKPAPKPLSAQELGLDVGQTPKITGKAPVPTAKPTLPIPAPATPPIEPAKEEPPLLGEMFKGKELFPMPEERPAVEPEKLEPAKPAQTKTAADYVRKAIDKSLAEGKTKTEDILEDVRLSLVDALIESKQEIIPGVTIESAEGDTLNLSNGTTAKRSAITIPESMKDYARQRIEEYIKRKAQTVEPAQETPQQPTQTQPVPAKAGVSQTVAEPEKIAPAQRQGPSRESLKDTEISTKPVQEPQAKKKTVADTELFVVKEAKKEEKPTEATIDSESNFIDDIVEYFKLGKTLEAKTFFEMADKSYGGTRAQGKYGPSDAYDLLEVAVNKYLSTKEEFRPDEEYGVAKEVAVSIEDVLDKLPTQTNRSGEKDLMQQFSTPPHYAYAVNWLANINKNDVVLEPSAGVGGLAVFAKATGAKINVNELSKRRAKLLKKLSFENITSEDAEQIHNILPKEQRPTVVIMNPPFSMAAHRMRTKKVRGTDLKHIDAALSYLQDGGRLVAIMGRPRMEGTESSKFKIWINQKKRKYNIRANVYVGRGIYKKYGTSFPTRVLVIDKTGPTKGEIVGGTVDSIPDLMYNLTEVRNDRQIKTTQQPQVGTAIQERPGEGKGQAQPEQAIQPSTPEVGTGKPQTGRPVEETPAELRGPSGGAGRIQTEEGAEVPAERHGVESGEGRTEERPAVSNVPAGKPAREHEPAGPGTSADTGVKAVTRLQQKAVRPKTADKEAIFTPYKPAKFYLPGTKSHPASLVESTAMSATESPNVNYEISIPKKIIEKGMLSNIQLEAITYAGMAHEQFLPEVEGVEYRKGFFIGDGTGVGKGREIAGIILDNMNKGRKKAMWISVNDKLLDDAKRDWEGIGQNSKKLFDLGKTKAESDIKAQEGLLFVTYGRLRSASKDGAKRVDQLIRWFGEDYDGVIVFDESHKMANATMQKGERGYKKPSAQALAGLDLQSKLPNARILYVSATGATEVENLAYAARLGLWGPGTPFASQHEFFADMKAGGIATMELTARDMKAMGSYISRQISYNDGTDAGTVQFDTINHKLSAEQRAIYDKICEAWQVTLHNFDAALEVTGANFSSSAKNATKSQFWGACQRCFNQVITSMQTPSMINEVEQELKNGNSIVIQLTNTLEAAQERALAKLDKGDTLEDFDITPKEVLMQLVQHSFPVQQYQEFTDENGNIRSEPVLDSSGDPVTNRQAMMAREKLLDDLASLRMPDSPLDMIINHFGPEKVAEVTGRKRRVSEVEQPDGTRKREIQKRGKSANKADIYAFMDGKKRILVFSEAGGTGASYHADRMAHNQQKRVHYLLQAGWRADTAMQGLGRTHRSNQAHAPYYKLVTTDLKGQKRFISSIARRLSQMGALTRGERKSTSTGLFTAADNLEGTEARDTLRVFFHDLVAGSVKDVSLSEFEEQTGLVIHDEKSGGLAERLPDIKQFLNRLLAIKIDLQNRVFNAYEQRLQARVQQAIANGSLDQGMETYVADKIEKESEQVVYTHPESGSTTKYVKLKVSNKNNPISWDKVKGTNPLFYVWSKRGNRIYAVHESHARNDAKTGNIVEMYSLTGVNGSVHYNEKDHIDKDVRGYWREIKDKGEAKELWMDEFDKVPEYHEKTEHFITGLILPIWDRIRGKARVYRVITEDGEQLIGRTIPAKQVGPTLKALGVSYEKEEITPEEAARKIANAEIEVELSNQWKIRHTRVGGQKRLELKGPNFYNESELESMGVFTERIQYDKRYFIPVDKPEVIEKVFKRWPITDIIDLASSDPSIEGQSPMGGFVGGRPATVKVSAIVKENLSTGSRKADAFLARTKGFKKNPQANWLKRIAVHGYNVIRDFHYNPYLPKEAEFGDIREAFRHSEEIKKMAIQKADSKMRWALKPIEGEGQEIKNRFKAVEMKIIFDDMNEDVEKGLDLPPDISEKDVEKAKARADEIYNKYPSVRQAYDRLKEVSTEIANLLVEEGMLKPAQVKEFYFVHKVIKYLRNEDGFFGIPTRRPADYKKGYQKKRKGGHDYSTDVLERLVEHWAQVYRDVEYRRFLEKTLKQEQQNYFRKEYPDWKEFTVNEETGKKVRNLVPPGYKEVAVLPGRFYYSANGVTEDMAKAILNQDIESIEELLDKETAGKIRKVLAVGRKRSYIVREPVARQLYSMPTQAISTNPIYLFVKGFHTFIKGQILFNPLYSVPFHVTNFVGDAHKVFVAMPSALKGKYLTNYWREVIAAHRGEPSARFEMAQRYGVIGSGWVGTDIPELETILPEIAKAEQIGAARYLSDRLKHLWNLSKKVGSGREDWLRYALFDRLMDLKEQGKDIGKYSIKDTSAVKGITDMNVKAAKIARDIAGDYTAIGRTGRILSDVAVPFYRWMHLNLPWWPRMMKEYARKGQLGRLIYALMAAATPYIFSTIWNYSDEERRRYERMLPYWKRWNFHVINKSGTKMYYVPLPVDDVMNFVGVPEDILDVQRYQRGNISAPQLAWRIAYNSVHEPGMSVVNAIGGLPAIIRDAVGWQTYPDIKDYRIKDPKRRALNVAGDIMGAPAQLGKAIDREGIKIDEEGNIILGPKTKDLLNRSWMGIRPYTVDIGKVKELRDRSVYKRTSRKKGQLRGQPHKGKKRKVDSYNIQLEGVNR